MNVLLMIMNLLLDGLGLRESFQYYLAVMFGLPLLFGAIKFYVEHKGK